MVISVVDQHSLGFRAYLSLLLDNQCFGLLMGIGFLY
jgi:hypothetical protein